MVIVIPSTLSDTALAEIRRWLAFALVGSYLVFVAPYYYDSFKSVKHHFTFLDNESTSLPGVANSADL